ncbi:MAG: hypothetical protein MUC51_02570 [Anaerolineae bacterium]|jgi:hypothetical protein|nr:hypothetical protein [Anaerolineae bacterium]
MGRIELNELVGILFILALAATVRFLNLGDAALWLDELATVRIAQQPWDILWITAYDPTPPVFYTSGVPESILAELSRLNCP